MAKQRIQSGFLGTVSNKYKQDSAALMLAINVHFDYNKNEYEQHLKVVVVGMNVKKWYDEEYEFEIEVTGFLRGNRTEQYCRNGEEIGDKYICTYGCPVNSEGYGICSKAMMIIFPVMETVRSGGNLENISGSGKYCKDIVCPDGCVMFRLTAKKLENDFYKSKIFD